MRRRPRHPLARGAVLGVFCLTGCGAAAPVDEPVVRDSAGVTIIENAPGAAEAVPRWVAGPEPTLRIGVVDGDPAYQFHGLYFGARLSDGRVAVVDMSSREVRVYDGDGRIVATQGREGDGPGEYRAPEGIWILPGDSIAVFDRGLSRVTILTPDAELARVATVSHGLTNPELAGTLENGRRVVVMDRHYDISGGIEPQYADVWTAPLDGTPADSILRVVHGRHGIVPGAEEMGRRVGSPVFGAIGIAAARGDRLVYGSGEEYAIRVHEGDGRVSRIIRWHGPDRTTDPATAAAWVDSMVARTPEARRPAARRWFELLPIADRTPAHDRILFDTAGRLWVSRWSPWDDERWTDWWVFDPDGRLVATAELPAGMWVLWVGDDELIERVEDEVGVEYVVVVEVGEWGMGEG